MKRTVALSCILCLLAGLLVGGILPMPWDEESPPGPNTIVQPPSSASSTTGSVSGSSSSSAATLDSTDNFGLLGVASYAVQTLKEENYTALAALVHPELGVTFTPYSTVDANTDRTLTRQQVAVLEKDTTVYTWGSTDGSGEPIQLTVAQYIDEYVFDSDYTRAPQIGLDRVIVSGNALENVAEAYPGCRFVDFSLPGSDGTDWSSLKLVFQPSETSWYLVAVIHGEWTI